MDEAFMDEIESSEGERAADCLSGALAMREIWNRCDVCGRMIGYGDIENGRAIHKMETPDSDVSYETWKTLCRDHYQPNT